MKQWLGQIKEVILTAILVAFPFPVAVASAAPAGSGPSAIAYNEPSFFQNIEAQVVWNINPDNPSTKQRIASGGLLSAEHPVWSRDGQLIAAVGLLQGRNYTYPGGYAIVVFDPTGAKVERVAPLGTTFGSRAYVAFSPDKTRLVYVDGSPYWSDFYVVDRNRGSQPIRLGSYSSGESDYTGTGIDWSPTADELITPIGIAGNSCNPAALPVPVTALVLARLDGNRVSGWQLVTCPPVVKGDLYRSIGSKADDVHPVFSRDGRYVAFVRWISEIGVLRPNQLTSSIRVIDLKTKAERELISIRGVRVCGLSWSGDGKRLVFDASEDIYGVPTCGNRGLWIIGLDGTGPSQLLKTTASSPSWSWAP